jgi:hypothetical protein
MARAVDGLYFASGQAMSRKLESGQLLLSSRKKVAATGKRMNLGRFDSREKVKRPERAVQF